MPRSDDDDYDRPRRRDDDADHPRRDRDRDDNYDRPPPRRKSGSKTLVIVLVCVFGFLFVCGGVALLLLVPAVSKVRESANRMKSSNNMKQIWLGCDDYAVATGELPSNTYSADGKPLLSWRVHILQHEKNSPGSAALFAKFKLDEPWDGPNNKQLLDQMPGFYQSPSADKSPRLTHYRGFSSPGAVFSRKFVQGQVRPPGERLLRTAFPDKTANTIALVEAADPVEWTKPDDLDAAPGKPFPRLGTTSNVFLACLGDGSVKPLRQDLPETTLRALVTYAGGEALPADWDAR